MRGSSDEIILAPLVGRAGAVLTFTLTADDGLAAGTATVNVLVEDVNHAPTAEAGADQTRDEATLVTLEGTGSRDPEADPLTYAWTQRSGVPVPLADPTSATPTFTAPLVGPGGVPLVFELIVHDGLLESAPDTVTIHVVNRNDPPECARGQAAPALLWPPNHKLTAVGIVNVTDSNNNDRVTITVTDVRQDEPVHGLGDGDTSPDAVLQSSTVLLRAEWAGGGTGRVYYVTFTADDGAGGSCTGAVTVCVPHDRRPGTCGDEGPLYDATQP